LNELWGLKLSQQNLLTIAAKLGSDVFFFLHQYPLALVEGKGEKATLLPSPPPSWVVLLVPPVEIPRDKTGQMYRRLKPSQFTRGQFSQRLVESLRHGEEIAPNFFYNVFEEIAFDSFPGLEQYWQAFRAAGASSVHLTGAGPVLFTWLEEKSPAEAIYHRLRATGWESYLVSTLKGGQATEYKNEIQ
jgi:4-diphosphocytidyl-2-C-methyl-D-erythritol kinase